MMMLMSLGCNEDVAKYLTRNAGLNYFDEVAYLYGDDDGEVLTTPVVLPSLGLALQQLQLPMMGMVCPPGLNPT
jgi:hypothetical protein